MPPIALVYGARPARRAGHGRELGGLVLILAGVALGSGAVHLARRSAGGSGAVSDVRIRRATRDDLDFLSSLHARGGAAVPRRGRRVRPRRAARRARAAGARSGRRSAASSSRSDGEPRAGTMGFERVNERSRIAHLERLAVHPRLPRPARRGRRRAPLPAPPDLRPRLPPARDGGLRLQRARAAARRARRLDRGGREAEGVPARRRVGRRRHVRDPSRGSRSGDLLDEHVGASTRASAQATSRRCSRSSPTTRRWVRGRPRRPVPRGRTRSRRRTASGRPTTSSTCSTCAATATVRRGLRVAARAGEAGGRAAPDGRRRPDHAARRHVRLRRGSRRRPLLVVGT